LVTSVPVGTEDPAIGGDAGAALADLSGATRIAACAAVEWIVVGIGADTITNDLSWRATAHTVLATHAWLTDISACAAVVAIFAGICTFAATELAAFTGVRAASAGALKLIAVSGNTLLTATRRRIDV